MYHGATVPGFPQHPHRGFETVTIVRRGLIDHSDSLGADGALRARRRAVAHGRQGHRALRDVPAARPRGRRTRLELFQIWLNLPARRQDGRAVLRDALGRGSSRGHVVTDGDGRRTRGDGRSRASSRECARRRLRPTRGRRGPRPTSRSGPRAGARARGTLPPAARRTRCARSTSSTGSGRRRRAAASPSTGAASRADADGRRSPDGSEGAEVLLLQGRPIGEPVAQYGPFVMNTRPAFSRRSPTTSAREFGGWPWPDRRSGARTRRRTLRAPS